MLAQSRTGTKILEFIPGDALHMGDDEQHIPLTFAMVILVCAGKVLLIYNNRRKQWEVPGGKIDAGETVLDAAKRELYEETGQTVAEADLMYVGRLKFAFVPDYRVEFGVLYVVQVDTIQPFAGNDEVTEIMLHDISGAYPQPDGEISRFILQQTKSDYLAKLKGQS